MRTNTKFGPDWFSRFDVFLDTNGQTDRYAKYLLISNIINLKYKSLLENIIAKR